VLTQLRTGQLSSHGVLLILGEPGSGKSTLLKEWHARWVDGLVVPRLGLRVPVLVRVREVQPEHLAGTPDTMADRLWEHHGHTAAKAVSKNSLAAAVFDLPLRLFTPVWLLDGLDEAQSPGAFRERELWERLAALPGDVAATCRTAMFQSARPEAAGLIAREHHILGLEPLVEQPSFLAKALETERKDAAGAPELVRRLNASPALRPLAAIPLLLRLVAQMGDPLALPNNRAGFYDQVTNELWNRRVRTQKNFDDVADARDTALATLAGAMGLSTLEADRDQLKLAGITGDMKDKLRQSELLHFDDRRRSAVFPHLTFQEFHLARSWLGRDFAGVLNMHWDDPQYEEALALLVALHWNIGQASADEVERKLRAFVDDWRARHARDRTELWRIRRSPHVVAISLVRRAGVNPRDPLLGAADAPSAVRRNLARRSSIPVAALSLLAKDADAGVRSAVAENAKNAATPSDLLALLAKDPFMHNTVANNPATPPGALAFLAKHSWSVVERQVARHAATPPDVLAFFAKDITSGIRGDVAGNAATPPNVLALLAKDANAGVRGHVARNHATPLDLLTLLFKDADAGVRSNVARNHATPLDLLTLLSKDADAGVRGHVARNPAALLDSLALLSTDADAGVRGHVARNPATPPDVRMLLAKDADAGVRGEIARDAATPPDTLSFLAKDTHKFVRSMVAGNAVTLPDTLSLLAKDADEYVRRYVAGNAATPPDVLALLAKDDKPGVRQEIAGNAATPPDALALLTRDFHDYVRNVVARNTATPPDVLTRLAKSCLLFGDDPTIAGEVAGNPATPPDALALLAKHRNVAVRYPIARNAATPPDALILLAGTDTNAEVRKLAAGNAATLPEDLWLLTRSSDDLR
jgi:hypothetical protein